jgi:hypothetical protein
MTSIGSVSNFSSADRKAGYDQVHSGAIGAYDEVLQKWAGSDALEADSISTAAMEVGPYPSTFNAMGRIIAATSLVADLKPINVSELPEDQYQIFMEQDRERIAANTRFLENQYAQTSEPDYSDDPRLKPYATITVGGEVIATIDNQGVVGTYRDDLGQRINKLLTSLNEGLASSGPAAATRRADEIASLLGGRIVLADTAMTQTQYNALAPFEQSTTDIDYEAMKKDPLYEQLQATLVAYEKIQKQRADYIARQ